MNIYENKYSLIKKRYSFNSINIKLWNDGNRVKQTLFWSIQKLGDSFRSPLATLLIS
jgi:hypothetical protein